MIKANIISCLKDSNISKVDTSKVPFLKMNI